MEPTSPFTSGQLGDGTILSRFTPAQVKDPTDSTGYLTGVTVIATGDEWSVALKSDGTVWAWGDNFYGQLGDGTTEQRHSPVQVSDLDGVAAIVAGGAHSLALKSGGTVWAWGDNWNGALGDGTTDERRSPVQVSNLTAVTTIAAGGYHSLALKSDGTVWAWGSNWKGQLGDKTTTNRLMPVQVTALADSISISGGYFHSLALRSDGTVWAWGWNRKGQLGDGTTIDRDAPVQVVNPSDPTGYLTGVIVISSGHYSEHSLAIEKPLPDADGDGILDAVDVDPDNITDQFSDISLGGTTNGTITDRGDQIFFIADATDSLDGVSISADAGGGGALATVSVCGGAGTLTLDAGDEVVVTCGSVTIKVISGTVEITFVSFEGIPAAVSLDADYSLLFDPATLTFTAPPSNPGTVVVLIEGNTLSIEPGESKKPVEIDLKPGSDTNCLNNDGHGVIPVALLGSADFDVSHVDQSTLSLQGLMIKVVGKSNKLLAHIEDVNEDGNDDLVLQIEDEDGVFNEGSTIATLTGSLYEEYGGTLIEGSDSICIVP